VADAFLLNMRNLSKSKYLNGVQCRKLLWVAVNDAGRIPQPDVAKQYIFDQGHLVGEPAHRLYPNGIKLDTASIAGNLKQMQASLSLRRPLVKVGFSARGLYCRVDVTNSLGRRTQGLPVSGFISKCTSFKNPTGEGQ
jgi:hypothetical protein